MTRQFPRLHRASFLAAAAGLALGAAPASAAPAPKEISKFALKKGKITSASLKEEILMACREQTKVEDVTQTAPQGPPPPPPPPVSPPPPTSPPVDVSEYYLCQALGTGSEAPCSSAGDMMEACVEGFRMHQMVMQSGAAAVSACLNLPGMRTFDAAHKSEACQLIAAIPQDGDIEASCAKLQPFSNGKSGKGTSTKKKMIRDCVRSWKFIEGELACDDIGVKDKAAECVSYARTTLAAKNGVKECLDTATCKAAITHSTAECPPAPNLAPPKVEPVKKPEPPPVDLAKEAESKRYLKAFDDYCEMRAADQERREMSDEAIFRKEKGRPDYKPGEPLLHLLPPEELPPAPPAPGAQPEMPPPPPGKPLPNHMPN